MILAFDTSVRRTGWVKAKTPTGPVRFGSFGVPEHARANLGLMLKTWEGIAWPLFEGVMHVYFEAPILPHGPSGRNVTALRQLWALAAHVEYLAHHAGADCAEVDNGAHKRIIYSHGGAKPENAVEYAAAWGLPVRNPDEADAFGVMLAGLRSEFPEAFNRWLTIRRDAPPIARVSPPPRRPQKGKPERKHQRKRPGPREPSLL